MSNVQTVINSQTAAASSTFDSAAYAGVVFHAEGLAAAEEVDILLGGGLTAVPLCKDDGAPVVLTAGAPSYHAPGGPFYVINKDATIAAASVFASPRSQ